MKLFHIVFLFAVCCSAFTGEMQNGRIRFEESAELKQIGKTIFFPVFIRQKSGDHLVIEAEDFSVFAPMANEHRLAYQPEYSNGCAVVNAGRLGYDFSIAQPGEYQVWIRAFFPLRANYNHNEKMDDGPFRNISDSADHNKVSKTARRITSRDHFLEPGFWHWIPNFAYDLAKGKHHWDWGNPAWGGGCILDKIVLIRKGSPVKPENAETGNRECISAKAGVLLSRRIKLARIASWKFEYIADPGDGHIQTEFSCDEEHFQPLKNGERYFVRSDKAEYLRIRIRMKNASENRSPPIIYHYAFFFEKKKP